MYDIRGKTDAQLTPVFAFYLGRAFACHIASKGGVAPNELTLCVGRDCRLSSPELEEALASGMAHEGVNVIRVGLLPTPALYFSVKRYKADGGIMVTGSHNPKNDNGFKCMDAHLALHGPAILDLCDRMEAMKKQDGDAPIVVPSAPTCFRDVSGDYVDRILSVASYPRTLAESRVKAAWDPGNGAAGDMLHQLISRLPGEHILINAAPDGNFPAHHPDPSDPQNMLQLQEAVRAEGCDVGFAFDGDGDRLGVVDGRGEPLSSDALGFTFARDCVEKFPEALCVFDVKTSGQTFSAIERVGGRTLMGKTGHSLMKEKMKLSGAIFGAEASGHLFFAEHDGFDDAIFAAVRFLDVMHRRGESAEMLGASLPRGSRTPEWRLDVGEKEKWRLLDGLKNALRLRSEAFNDLDGIRVDDEEGWWVARASNTQPAVVVMAEGRDEAALRRRVEYIDALCREAGFSFPLFKTGAISA
ncbi:MAG: phosphomannomutase/phosphoglucomutase [Rickettsiales bacterium]